MTYWFSRIWKVNVKWWIFDGSLLAEEVAVTYLHKGTEQGGSMKAQQLKMATTASENYSKETAYSDDYPQCFTYLRNLEKLQKSKWY